MDAAQFLEQRFRDSFDDVLIVGRDGRSFTYGQYWANAQAIAAAWQRAGVPRGATVALVLANDTSVLACYLACAIGGYVACPIIPTHVPEIIDEMLALARPALIVRRPPLLDPQPRLPRPTDIAVALAGHERFAIMLTSGTTSAPKGICHRLQAMIDSARAFAALSGMHGGTRLYHVLPMAYMAGVLNTMLAPMCVGGTIIEGPPIAAATAFEFWARPVAERANFLTLVPSAAAVLSALARDGDAARRDAAGLEHIQCTAGQLQSAVRQRFLEAFERPLQDCYGLTELGGPLTTQTPADARVEENVGYPVAGLELRLVPSALGDPELWIHSPFAMEGYLTAAGLESPFDNDGFMATGDLARIDAGKLHITGRSKDCIVRGGINVAPVMIENQLGRIEGVEEVAVVGMPDNFWGEIIVACVIAAPETDPQQLKQTIFSHAGKSLDTNLRPDRVVTLESFPRASTGKVQKHHLRSYLTSQPPG